MFGVVLPITNHLKDFAPYTIWRGTRECKCFPCRKIKIMRIAIFSVIIFLILELL
jgi:hypothetical protein